MPRYEIYFTECTTTFTYCATDNMTNRGQEKSIVLKLDKTAPTVNIFTDPAIIESTAHKMVGVKVDGTVSDNLSGIVTTSFTVDDEYNLYEPKLASFGNTIKLDAWCNDKDKNGRTYTIFATVKDRAGNQVESKAIVTCLNGKAK